MHCTGERIPLCPPKTVLLRHVRCRGHETGYIYVSDSSSPSLPTPSRQQYPHMYQLMELTDISLSQPRSPIQSRSSSFLRQPARSPRGNVSSAPTPHHRQCNPFRPTDQKLTILQSEQPPNPASSVNRNPTLPPTSNIYKLVGPVLLKQERNEAVIAVEGRLDFIDREIRRLEKQIQETQTESEGMKMEVYRLQTQMQG